MTARKPMTAIAQRAYTPTGDRAADEAQVRGMAKERDGLRDLVAGMRELAREGREARPGRCRAAQRVCRRAGGGVRELLTGCAQGHGAAARPPLRSKEG